MKILRLWLAALLALSIPLSACNIDSNEISTPPPSSESESSTSSKGDSDSSTDDENELAAAWAIVDAAYELKVNESLEGTHTLTGTVIRIEKVGKKDTVTIAVEGREDKPIYCYGITGAGVGALKIGDIATVSGTLTNYQYTIEFDKNCVLLSYQSTGSSGGGTTTPPLGEDPYANVSKTEFYQNYTLATDNTDAYYRSVHGFLSGELEVPDQAPTPAREQPQQYGTFIRNREMLFSEDKSAYTVVDEYGEPAFTVYRNGAYITLEEVAAFVYAFGTYPANYTTSKNTEPADSVFGEYLRLNHTSFSGSTSKYPYEPMLPNITGCGGTLRYYEMDIGTTGTDCDPKYPSKLYNDGSTITRGAARIVYGKTDLNGNGIFELNEHHVFYTYNHYNDFQEYLNYQGGWGEKFGNITGGGAISSTTNYNPTPYVNVFLEPLPSASALLTASYVGKNYKTLLTAHI